MMITEKIAEFEKIISSGIDEIQRADAMNQLAFEIRNTDTHRSISLSKEAQKIASEINYSEGNATALNNEGFCYVQITDYELALEKLFNALRIFEDIKNEKGSALSHYNLCLVYQRLGDYNAALDHVSKSLSYQQKVNDKFEMARCYMQLGFLYSWMNDNETSIEVYMQGLNINRELNNKAGEAAIIMGIGQTYLDMREYEKSREYLLKSMEIREEIKDWRGYAATMNSYMTLCYETEKYEEAEKISLKGIKLATELGDKMGISRFMVDLGKIYFKQNKLEEAERAMNEALNTAGKINLKMTVPPANQILSEIYRIKGDYQKALTHYQRFHEAKEELFSTDAALKAKSVQLTGKVENAQKEAEINRLKNVELKKAYSEIEEKNKDITDSINYALRIQQAILPDLEEIKKILPESFVLFKPRDIVSGDFYWFHQIGKYIFVAAADCTGHGVPGAFMSMIGISLLNEIIIEKQIHSPSMILDELRKGIIKSLKQKNETAQANVQDGMDIALCRIENDALKLEFAGANNPVFIVRNGKIIEFSPDKMPIGTYVDTNKPFTNHTSELQKGDAIYLLSDGYADQFGGPKGKKFMYKQLQELFLSVSVLTPEEQKNKLISVFEGWRGNLEQVDDVCVIGVLI